MLREVEINKTTKALDELLSEIPRFEEFRSKIDTQSYKISSKILNSF